MIHPISNAPFTGSNKLEVPGTLTPYGTSVPSTTGPSNFVQAGKLNASSGNAAAQSTFGTIRLIVTVGWAIYPIGYWLATGPGADMANANLIYNLADFINKIAFGLAIYVAAVSDSE